MRNFVVSTLSVLALAASSGPVPAVAEDTQEPDVTPEPGFEVLLGRWVRPDGGYAITIRSVDPDGNLDADYANPGPLPFAEARASRDGNEIRVFFELRAGGYNGSTYNLTYDQENDVLRGVYYQAVAKQRFDIYFDRVE